MFKKKKKISFCQELFFSFPAKLCFLFSSESLSLSNLVQLEIPYLVCPKSLKRALSETPSPFYPTPEVRARNPPSTAGGLQPSLSSPFPSPPGERAAHLQPPTNNNHPSTPTSWFLIGNKARQPSTLITAFRSNLTVGCKHVSGSTDEVETAA